MAKYRHKDDTELRWNRIRRRLTRELDTQIADVREELLNNVLTAAYDKFTAALEQGHTLEIEPEYEEWVSTALEQIGIGKDVLESLRSDAGE